MRTHATSLDTDDSLSSRLAAGSSFALMVAGSSARRSGRSGHRHLEGDRHDRAGIQRVARAQDGPGRRRGRQSASSSRCKFHRGRTAGPCEPRGPGREIVVDMDLVRGGGADVGDGERVGESIADRERACGVGGLGDRRGRGSPSRTRPGRGEARQASVTATRPPVAAAPMRAAEPRADALPSPSLRRDPRVIVVGRDRDPTWGPGLRHRSNEPTFGSAGCQRVRSANAGTTLAASDTLKQTLVPHVSSPSVIGNEWEGYRCPYTFSQHSIMCIMGVGPGSSSACVQTRGPNGTAGRSPIG